MAASVMFARWAWHFNDFADNPALLVKITHHGNVLLDTYRGPIEGPLAGVTWPTSQPYLSKANDLVAEAQTDEVDWSVHRDGIHIWYMSSSGKRSLNDDIREVTRP
jgi:hypothetical protein